MRLLIIACVLLSGLALHAGDRPPELIKRVRPVYPPWLRGPEVGQGEVVVQFVVTRDGRPTDVTVVRSAHPMFSQAAVASVKQWVFRPGTKSGMPGNWTMQVPIVFTMDGFLGELFLAGSLTCLNEATGAELPTLVTLNPPKYPGKHWRTGTGGSVVAEFSINASGMPAAIEIREASHPEFGESVRESIASFRFLMDATYVGTPRVRLDLTFLSPAMQKRAAPKSKSQS